MLEAPYEKDKDYDRYLVHTFQKIRDHIDQKDDDFLNLLVGEVGTGKSMLGLHILGIYTPQERLKIDQVALSRDDFANSLKTLCNEPKPRALMYDEANVSKRDSLTKWNKDLIDLYSTNRGLNFLHLWCNPSLSMIDKAFVEDRIKAVILIKNTKNADEKKPRFYYYFRRADLLRFLQKHDNLNIDTLTKYRKKFAWYRGWFKDYHGPLREAYKQKKLERMTFKVNNFYEKYGSTPHLIKISAYAKSIGVSPISVHQHMKDLRPDIDYFQNPASGVYMISESGILALNESFARTQKGKKMRHFTSGA